MARFSLKDSKEHYLCLSEQPKRFDPDSPVTNVFFDDTNGEVFTVRSGGVTGITVTGADETISTSFRMEDRGPIISIKFSPDHKILAIQRNVDNQNASVEFVNFQNLELTNVEYSHTCKWKNAKILGFVWPKVNEIAYITDHGIELLQVIPEKKQLKSLKNSSFSGAWFSWCARSNIVLLAGNNGALLQPFSLNNSSVSKLQKLELESSKPIAERDVFLLRLCDTAWCALFKHGVAATAAPSPTEMKRILHMTELPPVNKTSVWLLPISGTGAAHHTHVLKTGLVGRFAVSVVDDLVAVHHQSSQTSQVFDILEDSKVENGVVIHIPVVGGASMQPAMLGEQICPMYSVNWVVFQPDLVIDARLGCLWRVQLIPSALAHDVSKDEIPKVVACLLRRAEGKPVVYDILHQLIGDADKYLVQLSAVFDEINAVYRQWADSEVSRNTAGSPGGAPAQRARGAVIAQPDMCTHVLHRHADNPYLVQVVTAYLASLSRHSLSVQHAVSELVVRALVTRGCCGRLRALVRRGCLGDGRPLSCQLLSLGHLDPPAAQLALDMMWRLKAYEEIVEVLLSWNEPITAIGAAKQAGQSVWSHLAARKILAAAKTCAEKQGDPSIFTAAYHALRERNDKLRGSPNFVKGEQCDSFVEYYKQLTSDN